MGFDRLEAVGGLRRQQVEVDADAVVPLPGAGLVYGFVEIDGAEIIVDGHVVARVRRGETRKSLDILAPEAEQVVLRLMFADARHPEFELALWDAALPVQTSSPGEALRLGRRWLSHLEALLKG